MSFRTPSRSRQGKNEAVLIFLLNSDAVCVPTSLLIEPGAGEGREWHLDQAPHHRKPRQLGGEDDDPRVDVNARVEIRHRPDREPRADCGFRAGSETRTDRGVGKKRKKAKSERYQDQPHQHHGVGLNAQPPLVPIVHELLAIGGENHSMEEELADVHDEPRQKATYDHASHLNLVHGSPFRDEGDFYHNSGIGSAGERLAERPATLNVAHSSRSERTEDLVGSETRADGERAGIIATDGGSTFLRNQAPAIIPPQFSFCLWHLIRPLAWDLMK